MRNDQPWNKTPPEECNALFERMGKLLNDSFVFAHRLGIKTCIGTETPLTIPTAVKQRLRAAGKNPDDPAVVQEIYKGMSGALQRRTRWTTTGCGRRKGGRGKASRTAADRRGDERLSRDDRRGEKSEAALRAGDVRLGARPAARDPSLFDHFGSKDMAMSLHQPHGGQHAGRARLPPR